ncbi:M3 family oligoendopeptidase [Desulforhopalus sp. IMCC35007]|uniref:M3 family oligoendopeptidase n=1 Tax=Desulforhopalus sp. IMCC35007 TaxID=2569543 RepID=UPI0010AE7F3B|nr:M3 family oligoendopeptidase [Desulforhopalus sp. IMCC35007]TKB07161.1 oligoendopeptidase F [Desulforhopalus sp. IMCC35007]
MTETNPLNEQLGTTDITWNLGDLFSGPKDPAIDVDITWCETEAVSIRRQYYQKMETLHPVDFLDLVTRIEALDCKISKLATYSFLNFTTQMANAEAGALDQRIREVDSKCGTETVFFELEWNMLTDEKADFFLADSLLAKYKHYLLALRKHRPHQLSEAEEKILLEKEVSGRRSWTTLFNKVLSSYKFGENQRTEEEVLTDLYSESRDTRKTAADELTEGLKANSHILTHIFNTLAADKMVTDKLRHHSSWVSSMNLDNELQDDTVATLVDAVTSRYDIVQRYYRVKKDILGVDMLEDFDRYAPLPSLPSTKIGWDPCKDIVLSSFAAFSPDMAEIAADFFNKNWIHAPIGQGKRGGAFAHPCVPDVHPYVLVNYTGNLRDVSTVAHELGHGIHQVLASAKGHFNSNTPLPLAETASVFAELLVFNSQLNLLQNKDERRAFICQKLESIFATVFRQTAMNRFEELMHNGRRTQGELSCDQLSEYWLSTQRAMFGDSVLLREDYGIWWSYIPHFLSTPGYVYSYAFGELLVLALYGIYKKEGEAFVKKYLDLLAAGGSLSPYTLMQPFGIDLDQSEFWQGGLDVIEQLLIEVE